MNKPQRIRTPQGDFPKGEHIVWIGNGQHDGVNLGYLQSPSVQVDCAPTAAITFEGSFDGENWSVIRDKEGEVVRIIKDGMYRLPVAVVHVRPVSQAAIVVRLFIQR